MGTGGAELDASERKERMRQQKLDEQRQKVSSCFDATTHKISNTSSPPRHITTTKDEEAREAFRIAQADRAAAAERIARHKAMHSPNGDGFDSTNGSERGEDAARAKERLRQVCRLSISLSDTPFTRLSPTAYRPPPTIEHPSHRRPPRDGWTSRVVKMQRRPRRFVSRKRSGSPRNG